MEGGFRRPPFFIPIILSIRLFNVFLRFKFNIFEKIKHYEKTIRIINFNRLNNNELR